MPDSISQINEWLYNGLIIIYMITILSTVIVVISENRNPVKTIAWVVVLLLLPVVGIVFYFYFGQDYTKYRMISRKSLKKLRGQEESVKFEREVECLSDIYRQLIRLNYATNGALLYSQNAVMVYTAGREKFDALKTALNAANRYILIQYYIFENDQLGNEFKAILIEKARRGVDVRLIYDDVGCWHVKDRFFTEMAEAGVKVYPFLKVRFPRLTSKINYRNHRKIVVVDGVIGFMGGMNIADRYQNGVEWGIWRDTHMKIEGPAVMGLQSAFAVDWYFTSHRLLSDEIQFPQPEPAGDIRMQIVTGGPVGEWKEIEMGIFRAISNARKSVYIQTPYFLPTDSLITALRMAALSKVDVRIMLPSRGDSIILQRATGSFLTQMLKAGVKIYFYKKGFLHAKSVIIDEDLSIVGSTNLDFRSFEHNFEVNAFMYDRELTARLRAIFQDDQQQCQRITLRLWRRRPLWQKTKESFWRLLSPLL